MLANLLIPELTQMSKSKLNFKQLKQICQQNTQNIFWLWTLENDTYLASCCC